jgi:hypothetical protein
LLKLLHVLLLPYRMLALLLVVVLFPLLLLSWQKLVL